MGCLPDEIWTEVLKSGVERRVLDYRDLCILALVCRCLRRLSSLDSLWHLACQNDFGNPEGEAAAADAVVVVPAAVSATLAPGKRRVARNCKLLYSARFEKIRNAKLAARRRQILRVESHLAVLKKQAKQFHARFLDERSKLSQTVAELKNLEHGRQAEVAVQVWQPQAVRARHQEMLEQQPVNAIAQQRSLQMEVKVCRERIRQFALSRDAAKAMMESTAKELEILKFNPTLELHSDGNEPTKKAGVKRKHDCPSSTSQESSSTL
ncbi:unnamed protein product [Sphagnum tenellum]